LPSTASAEGLIAVALQLEQIGDMDTALRVYQAVIKQWPKKDVAIFGAGNSAYARGYFDQADVFFSQYLERNPRSAEAWNNLSYTLAELGCTKEAKTAINCALKLDPENNNLLESQKDILQYSRAQTDRVCRPLACF
jgi:tetratricopeptide (TPR) repeat protein